MIEDYFFTKKSKWVIWSLCAAVVAFLIFQAGAVVGQRQLMRGHGSDKGSGPGGLGGMISSFMPDRGYMESSHGAVGTIATVTLPTFLLETRDGFEQKIYAGTSTLVTGMGTSDTSALKSGETVIVIGDPNDADDVYLDARVIHILSESSPSK